MNEWITDWDLIAKDEKYIVCAIAQRPERGNHEKKELYLYIPQIMTGWQVKRLMENCYAACYAALPMPEFKGLPQ